MNPTYLFWSPINLTDMFLDFYPTLKIKDSFFVDLQIV